MPELPEVETVRMGLEKYLVGHKIERAEVRLAKMVTGDTKHVIGAKVVSIERFGKGLVIHLSNGYAIAVHIKLTGQLIYRGLRVSRVPRVSRGKVGTLPNKATHVIFHLDKGATLYYNDFRQFGWIKVVKEDEVAKLPFFKELGPEFVVGITPMSSRAQRGDLVGIASSASWRTRNDNISRARTILTLERFKEILAKSGSPVKAVIMDQQKMSGVGNIYANDGLYLAGIDPRRKAKSLSDTEMRKLYESLLEVLKRGLKYGGATELSFVNVLGEEGGYQEHFLVYGREGQRCLKGHPIKKIKIGGRGTYFCPACQR